MTDRAKRLGLEPGSDRPRLGIWKVARRDFADGRLGWTITRNGEDVLDEPMIFKGQAVYRKERMRKVEEANVRDWHRENRDTRS